jgi:hypothetical protein
MDPGDSPGGSEELPAPEEQLCLGMCMASPAIANRSLILRTFTKLYRIGKAA